MLKRLTDLAIAVPLLILLCLPGLIVAAMIRLESPGPAFFRQVRVGRGEQPFRIHKFRTMQAQAEATGPAVTVGADARITRIGAWLRARRIDELPQLIDVVQGTMSLVGPRPEVPRYLPYYPADLRPLLFSVRPGITDPASLAFRDEAARLAAADDAELEYTRHVLPGKLAASAAYLRTANWRSDLAVMGRSLQVLWAR